MEVAKYAIKFDWKEFNISLDSLHAWLQANAGEHYCGMQAASQLEIWFTEAPSAEDEQAVHDKWEEIDEESDEAAAYQSFEDIKAAADAAKEAALASASAKLTALGLTEEEIAALKG